MQAGRKWRPWVTTGLIAILILIWVIMTVTGRSLTATETAEVQWKWGAAARPEMLAEGQYWRLLTANFLHIGWLHLAMNSYSLWVAGGIIEVLYGRGRLLYLFLVSGILSVATSLLFGPPAVYSAGASGGIMGLVGALVWYRLSSPMGRRILWKPLLITLLLNAGLGVAFARYLDNWAHVGGFVGGLLAAAAVAVPAPVGWPAPRFYLGKRVHALLAGALALAALLLTTGRVALPGPGHDLARAMAAHEAGRWAEAEAGYLQAIRRQPDEPLLRYLLTDVYVRQGKCGAAHEQLQAFAALDPGEELLYDLASRVFACGS